MTATVRIGQQPEYWTPEVRVFTYTPDAYGDWRTSYRNWQPVTLYERNGHFYTGNVPGTTAVAVYRWGNDYFLPPQDPAWANRGDRRYNYDRRPNDGLYGVVNSALGLFGVNTQPSWGREIIVRPYDAQVLGDWRRGYRQWQPVTLYYLDHRFFERPVPGGRAVAVYRYRGQYFMPPQDDAWRRNADRRFNYQRLPNDDDYNTARRSYPQRPPQ
ncbi:MAG: hypothetical protein ABUL71_00930 [Gemmatimonadota bacterium]